MRPGKPVGPLHVDNIQRNTATLRWQAPHDMGGADLTNYIIEKRNMKKTTWTHVDTVEASSTSHTVSTLREKNDYLFRVYAENKAGLSEPLESLAAVTIKSPYGEHKMHFPH